MDNKLNIWFGRHRAKDKSVKVEPCSNADINLIHLTEGGRKAAFEDGRSSLVVTPGLDLVYVARSPFVRVKETVEQRLLGAGYDLEADNVDIQVAENLGFHVVQYTPEQMALYENDPNYLKTFFKEHLFPKAGHNGEKPTANMAQFVFGTLDAFVSSYTRAQEALKGGASVNLGIETHSDMIDSAWVGLTGLFFGQRSPLYAFVNIRNLPEPIKDSEFIKGRAVAGTSDNPLFVFSTRDNGLATTAYLDQLKQRRDLAYDCTQKFV